MNIERELLFGVCAVRIGLIDPSQLRAACAQWIPDSGTLADLLATRQRLSPAHRDEIERAVAHSLKQNDADPRGALVETAGEDLRQTLIDSGNPAVVEFVTQASSKTATPWATAPSASAGNKQTVRMPTAPTVVESPRDPESPAHVGKQTVRMPSAPTVVENATPREPAAQGAALLSKQTVRMPTAPTIVETRGKDPSAAEPSQPTVEFHADANPIDAARAATVVKPPADPKLTVNVQSGVTLIHESRSEGSGSGPNADTIKFQGTNLPAAKASIGEIRTDGVSRYDLTKMHAKGGLGRIWVARDDRLNREVALKELQPHQAEFPEAVRRFLKEAQVTGQLEHPNIVPVYELGRRSENSQPFYTMRFLRGETLTEAIAHYHQNRRKGQPDKLELTRLLNAFVSVCHALAYAHSRGVIHRDLKPDNIILGAFGEVILLDWGLAKVVGEPDEPAPSNPNAKPQQDPTDSHIYITEPAGQSNETVAGTIMGTPGYMAPEQARGQLDLIDARTDIYGLGAILFEILTCRPPHEGKGVMATIAKIIASTTPRAKAAEPSTPASLDAICGKAMAYQPAERYEHARLLAADVQRFLADEPVLAYKEPFGQRLLRWQRANGHWVKWAALGLIGITVTSVAATLVVDGARRNESSAKKAAISAQTTAEAAHIEAVKNLEEAQRQKTIADQERDLAHRNLYLSQMHLGQQAWESSELAQLEQILAAQQPRRGVADLRAWEWYYLKALTHRDLRTLRGHTGPVNAALFLGPDESRVVSAGDDKTIHVWDVAKGQVLQTLTGHEKSISALAWCAEAQLLASASGDKTVKIWRLDQEEPLKSLAGHEGEASCVAWNADGTRLASGGQDGLVILWDAATGEQLQTLDHPSGVYAVSWSPDGKQVASASRDQNVHLWSAETGEEIRTLPGHTAEVVAVEFSPNGLRLATASWDETVRVWETDPAAVTRAITLRGHKGPVRSVAWHPDSKHLASGSQDRTIKVWDATAREQALTFRGHTGEVLGVSWSPDGSRVVSAGEDRLVKIWNSESGQDALTLDGHTEDVLAIAWKPDSQQLASAGADRTIRLWSPSDGSELQSLTAQVNEITAIAWNFDGSRLGSGGASGIVTIWDSADAKQIKELPGHTDRVESMVWSPDGKRLATASRDHTIRLWDMAKVELLRTLTGHQAEVSAVDWQRSGKLIASGSWDGTVRLWDPETGQTTLTLSGKPGVFSLAFSPDGQHLAAALADQTIKLWNLGKPTQDPLVLRGHSEAITSLCWSPDNKRIATASADDTLRIWDAVTGQEAMTLRGHTDRVVSVAWSPDGKQIATASHDRTIKIWDASAAR